MTDKPHIDKAPGLNWKPRKTGWEARWQARTDLRERGYKPRTMRLWCGVKPNEIEIAYIQERCNELQGQMLNWSHRGLPVVVAFDQSMRGLVDCYRSNPASPYVKKIRYRTRRFYDALTTSILDLTWRDEYGTERKASATRVTEIKRALIERWHETYLDKGHVAMGHQIMGMMRILFGFGAGVLEDNECARLCVVMSQMKFEMPKPRTEILTAEMAEGVRREAHAMKFPSIALAQAFQFDGMLRQKDVIGEWVPTNEKRTPPTEILSGGDKWIRGLRWESINQNMILRHVTSKRQKEIVLNLTYMPMVMEELGHPKMRSQLPAKGPIILHERDGLPWFMTEFRRKWRQAANNAGLPKAVRNMDTRAGAITEATQSGAPLESIKHAATHSDISMTQRYARAAETKTEDVQKFRMTHRNKSGS